MSEYYRLLKKAESYYFSIGSVRCSTLAGELIYFTRKGFRHFIRKKNGIRPISDQIRRLKLIFFVVDILQSKSSQIVFSIGTNYDFYSVSRKVNKNYTIKVIIGRSKKGKHYFFSVMDNKK